MIQRKDRITKIQQETLDFIKGYIARNSFSPTITEIRDHFKLASLRSVTQRLNSLEQKGLILREKYKQRGIRIAERMISSVLRQIPVLGTAGADNLTRVADQIYDEYLMVDSKIANPQKEVVAIRVAGRSMEEAGIYSGDYVIVEPTERPLDGDLVVAIIGDVSVVKRFRDKGSVIVLSPETKVPGYADIVLAKSTFGGSDFKMFGRVLTVLPSGNDDDVQIVPIE